MQRQSRNPSNESKNIILNQKAEMVMCWKEKEKVTRKMKMKWRPKKYHRERWGGGIKG